MVSVFTPHFTVDPGVGQPPVAVFDGGVSQILSPCVAQFVLLQPAKV